MDDRIYDRVRALVPPETRALNVYVAGAGMVGSWATAALARMVGKVLVVDHDTIEEANVGVQLYTPLHVGQYKAYTAEELNQGFNVGAEAEHMESLPPGPVNDVIVCCVDSMAGRKWLAEQAMHLISLNHAATKLFIDTRVLGEMVFILTFHDEDSFATYMDTIQPDGDIEDAPCGAEGTVYSGMFAATRIAAIVNNMARDLEVPLKEAWHVGLMQRIDEPQKGGDSGNNEFSASFDIEAPYEGRGEPSQEDSADADWQAEEAARDARITEADNRYAEADRLAQDFIG